MTEEQKAKFSKRLSKAVAKKIAITAGVTVAVVGVTYILTRKIDKGTVPEWDALQDAAKAVDDSFAK